MKKFLLTIIMFVLLFTLPTGGVSAQGADNSSYNGVETYPYDNDTLTLGQSFTKGWELKNSGTTTWDTANYTFELIEGTPAMGSAVVSLPKNVAPGETVLINVPMVAPLTAGLYKNRYQLKHNGVAFGSRPYVLIQVGTKLVPTPANANQLQPTAAANPNTITYITQSGISVVGTVAPNGVYVVNQANGGPAQRSRIEQQCKTTGYWWWAKTECSNVAITIDLPATPVNEEPKSLNGTQGTLYSFAAGFGVMTMSYPTYVSSAASSTLPSAINSAAIAAGASAAAPYVLVGILVCGPLILMYFSPATTYNGPSPIASNTTLIEDMFLESHTNQDHNPNVKISKAHTIWLPTLITAVAATGGNFDPNKFKCGVIKVGGTIIRAAIWMATDQFAGDVLGTGARGLSASYKVGVRFDPWTGSYPKSLNDFTSYQPSSAETGKGWSWVPMDCNDSNFPKPPTMLNAAQ